MIKDTAYLQLTIDKYTYHTTTHNTHKCPICHEEVKAQSHNLTSSPSSNTAPTLSETKNEPTKKDEDVEKKNTFHSAICKLSSEKQDEFLRMKTDEQDKIKRRFASWKTGKLFKMVEKCENATYSTAVVVTSDNPTEIFLEVENESSSDRLPVTNSPTDEDNDATIPNANTNSNKGSCKSVLGG